MFAEPLSYFSLYSRRDVGALAWSHLRYLGLVHFPLSPTRGVETSPLPRGTVRDTYAVCSRALPYDDYGHLIVSRHE